MGRALRHHQGRVADCELTMRGEPSAHEGQPESAMGESIADSNERALFALGHLFRWVLDGSGLEPWADGKRVSGGILKGRKAEFVAARFLALVIKVRPDQVEEKTIRRLSAASGIRAATLHKFGQQAEKDFGYIAPRAAGPIRPGSGHGFSYSDNRDSQRTW